MKTIDVIQTLSEYYTKELTPGTIRLYTKALDDLPVEQIDMAAQEYIKNGSPFMPKVTEIRAAAIKVRMEGKWLVPPPPVDPLKLIPGAAQTEEDLDERYGTLEEHRAIAAVFASGGELSERQQALLRGDGSFPIDEQRSPDTVSEAA